MTEQPSDPIDQAIASAEAQVEQRHTMNLRIGSTGRIVVMNFPIDLTEGEVAEWMGYIGTDLLASFRATRKALGKDTIQVARSLESIGLVKP